MINEVLITFVSLNDPDDSSAVYPVTKMFRFQYEPEKRAEFEKKIIEYIEKYSIEGDQLTEKD